MSLKVQPVLQQDAAEWDGFVQSRPEATPYHSYGWRSVIDDVYGHESYYLGAKDADHALRGVLPLVRIRSKLFGHFLVSMPFLNYGGPLGEDDAVVALATRAVQLADEGGVDLLELRSMTELPLDLAVSHRKTTVLLDLPTGDAAPLWDALKAKVRSQVRRPMKEGVEVKFGADQLSSFYRVFARHMRDLGTPVQSIRLFECAQQMFGDTMWFGCAYLDGEAIAAGSGFRSADRFELVWASALREHNRIAPNMLLYWRFIERCVEEGVTLFDFGRCTPGSGTHRFKLQWGGRDEKLWWYQAGRNAGGGTPSPDSGALSMGPRVWSRIPMPLANALGPRIVKYLP